MKPHQKLATKSAAPAFPLKFRVGESGFDSNTLMEIYTIRSWGHYILP